MNDIQTIADVEAEAARLGIALSADDYAAAHRLAEQRAIELQAEHAAQTERQGTTGAVARFNAFYPAFLKFLIGAGDVLITLTQTILIAFGVPGVLIMLLIVEQQRVYHGVELFETHSALAAFSASALVALNLILELLIAWLEHKSGYTEPPQNEFSLRLWYGRLAYIFGRADDWRARPKSPALRFRLVLRVVTFSILALALSGSMRDVISGTNGNWLEAIRYVVADSTLLQMATWIGGLLFAVAAVQAAQALSQFTAQKVIEIVAVMESSADDKPRAIANAAGLSAAMYLYGRLKDAQRQRRTGLAAAADMPDVLSGAVSLPILGQRDSGTGQDNSGTGTGAEQAIAPAGQRDRTGQTKLDRAVALLRDDPALASLSLRELETRTGIGKNVWSAAKRR